MTATEDSSLDRFCIHCGYNLRGLPSNTCPECGSEGLSTSVYPIPWEQRKGIGRIKAFWRTMKMACFQSLELIGNISNDVDDKSARSFRWIVIGLAAFPIIATYLGIVTLHGGTGFIDFRINVYDMLIRNPKPVALQCVALWLAGATRAPVLPIGLILTLLLGTGLMQLPFHMLAQTPATKRRAAIISQYLCAPLMAIGIPIISAILVLNFHTHHDLIWVLLLSLISVLGVCLSVLVPLLFWRNIIRAARVAGNGRSHPAAVTRPLVLIGGLFAGMIGFGLFPMIAGFGWLVYDSLR